MHTQATLQTMKRYRIGKVVGEWKNMVPPIQGGLYKVRAEAESDEQCDDASVLTDDDKQDSGIECDTASDTSSIDIPFKNIPSKRHLYAQNIDLQRIDSAGLAQRFGFVPQPRG